MVEDIVIVGANLGGGVAAEALRREGYEGAIHLIGEEPWRPYERPPLSKEVLQVGGFSENYYLYADKWYDENNISLHLGCRAEKLDINAGKVELGDGRALQADRVLLATGGRPRRLSVGGGGKSENLHYLRTRDDAERLAKDLRPGAKIVVVGMGVIGAEVAASANQVGCEVIVLEASPAPMSRMIGVQFSSWLCRVHEKKGVKLHFNKSIEELVLERDKVRSVRCSDGNSFDCDALVVGIGIEPAVELACDASLSVGNGIIVDKTTRTSNDRVFAVGDVAEQPGFFGGRERLETYQNAVDGANVAALSMLGEPTDLVRPSSFWTDQYEHNLQSVGMTVDAYKTIIRGDIDADEFTAMFVDKNNIVCGALSLNQPREMSVARRMVEQRVAIPPSSLADEDVPLRQLLKKSVSR